MTNTSGRSIHKQARGLSHPPSIPRAAPPLLYPIPKKIFTCGLNMYHSIKGAINPRTLINKLVRDFKSPLAMTANPLRRFNASLITVSHQLQPFPVQSPQPIASGISPSIISAGPRMGKITPRMWRIAPTTKYSKASTVMPVGRRSPGRGTTVSCVTGCIFPSFLSYFTLLYLFCCVSTRRYTLRPWETGKI